MATFGNRASRVSVQAVTVRGVARWRLDFFEQGKRRRQLCRSKAVADARAAALREEQALFGRDWLRLSGLERARLIEVWQKAKQSGVDLAAVLDQRKAAPVAKRVRFATALEECLLAKEAAGRAGSYCNSLRQILARFGRGREAVFVDELSLPMVEGFLDAQGLAQRATLRARLSTFFKFCVRREYCLANPCARLESVSYVKPPPQAFTVAEFKACLKALTESRKPAKFSRVVNYRHGLPWFVLTTVCGLRPEEAQQTTRREINFADRWIKVEAQTSKVRQRRVVYPRREAMALLKAVVGRWEMGDGRIAGLPLSPEAKRRVIHRLREALGWSAWPKDITRHTAATYWLAAGAGVDHVAEMLGNSPAVLKRDYQALKTRKEAVEFWAEVKKAGRETLRR